MQVPLHCVAVTWHWFEFTFVLMCADLETSIPTYLSHEADLQEVQQLGGSQRAMYRRLFMDIEREQVKESQRRREQQQRIQRYNSNKTYTNYS